MKPEPWTWRVDGLEPRLPNRKRGEHWSKAKRDRDHYQALLASANPPKLGLERFQLRCHRTYAAHPADFDNLVACFKPAIDALVKAGVLANDAPKHMPTPICTQSKRSKLTPKAKARAYFSITIEPLEASK